MKLPEIINNNLPLLIGMLVCAILLITLSFFLNNNELTDIEKGIKNHNSVQESISNPKYPILSKPANSQSTIINGDSVRVLKK